ncbi:DUF2306 domain-containing protein [Nocardiopsis ansamitocini]|uniref:Uncharacterized protein n=1 Tax=Nocardiopsis ansamitocini TaxID=1670832 RepID=A0A9W6P829_9ACTN|nr:DUF2306 domain-containing protein [Nocardiopsis ansamitocini]GLU48713.1 hypothetical protein Nans01_30640 [Nocardiopsis ansamitocini]
MTQNAERAGSPVSTGPPRSARPLKKRRTRWQRRVWMTLLVVAVTAFLAYELPPYLALDPSRAVIVLNEGFPLHYPLLIVHIATGTVAMVTACLQVWPWLRQRRPRIHRISGRLYVFAGVLPSALLSLAIMLLMPGWGGQVGITMHALLWMTTTVVGLRMARQRRYAEHRRWMLYSFALTMGILWGLSGRIVLPIIWPAIDVNYIFEVARWGGWVLNLIIVQWWLDRTSPSRPRQAA